MTFWLGAPHARFLAMVDVPLMVSRRTLEKRRTFPRALAPWVLDSGGFTEIAKHGRWLLAPRVYVALVRRFGAEIGRLVWTAIQDWMCEPIMLAKTGLTVAEHQRRTVASYVELRDLAPDLPWAPVLQGWDEDDYLRCVDAYDAAGVNLAALPIVGVGSVCRRQNTDEIEAIFRRLAALGLRLHGFGVKSDGLRRSADVLASADSMAWSKRAWKIGGPGTPECVGGPHKNCANCPRFALAWRARLLAGLDARWGAFPEA